MSTPLTAPVTPSSPADMVSAYRWVIAWTVLGLVLWAFSQLRVGYTILYYLAVLVLTTMLLTQYQAIASLLSPFSQNTSSQPTQQL